MSIGALFGLLTVVLSAFPVSCGGGDDDGGPASPTAASSSASPLAEGQVRITYYGHSMFTIDTPGGITILTDPNEGIGYKAPSGKIDVVTVSHEHFDHNKVGVAPDARVLRGLEDGEWADIDETIGDVRVRTVGTYHDVQLGAERGKNSMFVFTVAGLLTIVHAGDLGEDPTSPSFQDPAILEKIVAADVLLLPVGGHTTIGPLEADVVIEDLQPTLVIPMHYRTDFLHDFPDADEFATVDDFTAGKVNVLRPRESTVLVAAGPQEPTAIMVLEPQPE